MGTVWESVNAGATWSNLSVIVPSGNIVYSDWCGEACVWAAINGGGMFRSEDGGRTWAMRSSGLSAGFSIGYAAAHPTNASVALVSMCDGSGVFRTTDGGLSWQPVNTGLDVGGGQCYSALGLSRAAPHVLYVGGGDASHAWRSADGGDTWLPTGAPPAAQAYGLGLAASFLSVDPTDASGATAYYATWVSLFVTRDGGATWADATAFQPDPTHDPTGSVWVGTGYSGLVSTNIAFNPFSTPVPGRTFIQAMDAGKLWSDASAGGDLSSWRRQQGLNEFGGGWDVTFAADGTAYAGTGQYGWPASYSVEGVVKSVDGGLSWNYSCGHPANISGDMQGVAVSVLPHASHVLWAVFQDGRLYLSTDGCASWALKTAVNDTYVYSIARNASAAPAGDDPAAEQLYVAGQQGVWVKRAGGVHAWALLPGGPTAWQYSQSRCAVANGDAATLACTNPFWDEWHSGLWLYNATSGSWRWPIVDGTVYRWDDTAQSGGRLQAIATNENPYPEACAASGVWLSTDGGASWTVQLEGLRMRRVSALRFTPDGTQLIVGLNGGGFYVADVAGL